MSLDGLPASYSIKSMSLIRVPAHQAVYNPLSTSLIESHVFEADEFPVDPAETPCAYAPVGQGYFGYVGDVNNEEGSTKTILAMIHLLPSAILPATSKPTRGLIPLPNGRFEAAPDHDDPDAPAMFSDAIRRAGEQEMMIGNRVGRTGETLPRPTAGTSIVNSPSSAPISTRTPRRPRESEVEKRAVKRAAHSKKKKEKAEQLKDQGNELFRKGDYQKSIAFYKQAIAVRGPQPTYQANLAAAYLKLNMNSEAEAACEEALKYDPKHLKARFRRGSARLNMLCFKDAIQDFKACAKLGPTNPQFPAAIINTRQEFLKMKAAGYEDQWAGSGGQELDSDEEEDEDDGFDFLEPRLDDKPLEIVSENDSSDFEHEGNDVPCRFYNHDGCLKGSKCKFKHVPSKDTTRDELGRNVCNFWLLDGCRFGDRCVYAHSKEYLPEVGWWTSGEDMDLMQDVMNTLNQIRGFA
ncbi:hypothetical protein C8R43DRAFT_949788 [Mycena crocata]|nr:hypothetical protein C8R43DRAFT_949788 [Mycena crocata]